VVGRVLALVPLIPADQNPFFTGTIGETGDDE
jgi:hypothetical protein